MSGNVLALLLDHHRFRCSDMHIVGSIPPHIVVFFIRLWGVSKQNTVFSPQPPPPGQLSPQLSVENEMYVCVCVCVCVCLFVCVWRERDRDREHQQTTNNKSVTYSARKTIDEYGPQMTSHISQGGGQHEHGQVPTS